MRKPSVLAFATLLLAASCFAQQPVITDSLGRLKQLQAQIDAMYAKIIIGNLDVAHGGTGANLSGTGGTSQVLKQSTVGGNVTVGQLAASDLSNGTTGSGAAVLATSPTIATATLSSPTMTTPVLGAASATALNVSGLTASQAVFTDGSKNLVSVATTGSGSAVLAASPTITSATLSSPTMTTPVLGAASATTINKVAITTPATGSTLTVADGKTLTANNSIALSGTDATTMTFPTTSATIARTDASNTFTGDQTFSGKVNKVTITPPATAATLTIADGKTLSASNSLTLVGGDGQTITFPSTMTVAARDVTNAFTAPQTITTLATPLTITRPTTGQGNVSSSAGGSTLAGSGTNFSTFIKVGETITLSNGEALVVSSVTNDSSLFVTGSWINTCAGCTYTVAASNPLSIQDNGVAIGSGGTATPTLQFRVFTAGVERLNIDSTGRIGIGTLPLATLDVNGVINSRSTTTTGSAFVIGINNQSSQFILESSGSASATTHFGLSAANWLSFLSLGGFSNGLMVGTTTAKPLLLGTNDIERVRIDSTGNVGMGGTPSFPLHVINASGANQIVSEFNATHRSSLWNDGTSGYVGTTTNNPFRIRSNNTDAIFVDTSQNVGIGAASVGGVFEVETNTSSQQISRFRNQNAAGSTDVRLIAGTGTTSTSSTVMSFISDQTAQRWWKIGMNGSPTFVIRDDTVGSDRVSIDTNGNVALPPLAMTAGAMTVTNSAALKTVLHRFDWTNAMVTALGATTAGDIAVCTLPAKTVVVNAYAVITSAAGTVTTLSVAVGRTSASYIDYIVASDAKAAANTVYGDASAERGTNLTGYDLPSFTGSTLVNAHFISTGGNLNTVSASTGSVYLVTTTLP